MKLRRSVIALVVFVSLGLVPISAAAGPQVQSPLATDEEQRVYEAFRAWITTQPADVQQADDDVVYGRYAALLQTQGKSAKDASSTIELLRKIGDRAEVERWNRIPAYSPRRNPDSTQPQTCFSST